MRKFIIIGLMAAVTLTAAAGSILAQDETSTNDAQAWLGVRVVENNDQVTIARVQSGSPASAANLLIGDVIVSVNGTSIDSAADLSEQVQAAAPGDTVVLDLLRNGETLSLEAVLGSAPASVFGHRFGRGLNQPVDILSAAELLLRADLQEVDNGFEVVNVFAGRNPFDLQEGDIITTVNDQNIVDLDVETLRNDLATADTPQLIISVVRDGENVTLEIDVTGGFGLGRGFGGRNNPERGFRNRGNQTPGSQPPMPDMPEEVTPEPSSAGQA